MKNKDNLGSDNNTEQCNELFLKLLLENQVRIHAYILTLTQNYADADDILQQASTIMWRKFDRFEPGTDFVAWAFRISYYEFLSFYKKRKKNIQFDSDVLEKMMTVFEEEDRQSDARLDALRRCLNKLGERSRKLIKMRYSDGLKAAAISSRTGLTVSNIYKLLSRTHGQLLSCITRAMKSKWAVE